MAGALSRTAGTAAALLVGLLTAGPRAVAQQQGQPQRAEPPKWLDDAGKDLFNDLESEEEITYSGAGCEIRENLLKAMVGKGDAGASEHRTRVLLGLALCEFKKGDWVRCKKRWENMLSEFNAPSEDTMLQNPNLAPYALMKQAADLMTKHEVSQAGTALRRCREIQDRNLKKILKMIHKQSFEKNGPPVQKLIEELPGYGKTGQFLPMIAKQVPILKQDLPWAEMVDDTLDSIDSKAATFDASQKKKKDRLGVSRSASKEGSTLMYVRVLLSDATAPSNQLAVAQELANGFEVLKEEAGQVDKSVGLLKRTKAGPGCGEAGSMPKTCATLQSLADIQSNAFGETRLLVLKAGKKQALEACSTNANVGILLATTHGAQLKAAGKEPIALTAGEPVVVDFCQETSIEASAVTKVLFAQAWHPEFAAVERTTELRARAKAFGLAEAEVKAATEAVNKHAKKNWEKLAKQWRNLSETNKKVKEGFKAEKDAKQKMEEEAAEAKRKEEESGDEERKKGLEELERKRQAKRKQAEEEDQKRLRRKQLMEEERLKRDPWLNAPTVKAAEQLLADLKEQRRDANAKLEFDLSTQLTKDISAGERALKKAIKKAKKAFKKGGAAALEELAAKSADNKEKATGDNAKGKEEELAALKKKLEVVSKEKTAAAEAENFKEAKRLKAEQQELEDKISKFEL